MLQAKTGNHAAFTESPNRLSLYNKVEILFL
jgi:hypothetical protein